MASPNPVAYESLRSNPEQSAATDKKLDLEKRHFTKNKAKSKEVTRWGRQWNMGVYEKKVEGSERVQAAFEAGAITAAGFGLPLIDKKFREDAELAFTGSLQEIVFTEKKDNIQKLGYDPANKEQTTKKLGYYPQDSQSIIAFFKKPDTQYTEMGEYYVHFPTLESQGGRSTVLLVDRDFKKGKLIELHDRETGKPLKNKLQKERAAQTYIVSIADIKAKWKEELPKLAEKLSVLKGITVEQATKILRSRPKAIAISAQDGNARIYSDYYDPNSDFKRDSFLTGTLIKLEDDTKEEIKRVHGKSMKHKEPLEGKKPFKKPPQTPDNLGDYPQGRFGNGNADDYTQLGLISDDDDE